MSTDALNVRWSIWIDIEGFSAIWKDGHAFAALNALMSGVFSIGNCCYPEEPDRLFAHQFGDGFVIVSSFREESLDRCAAVAIALMRRVAMSGYMARAAIAEGEMAGYAGCWPPEIRDQLSELGMDNRVHLGEGLMTLIPVMGTALINAHKLDARNPAKGAIVTIATTDTTRLSSGFSHQPVSNCTGLSAIDWVHSTNSLIHHVLLKSGIEQESDVIIRGRILRYINDHNLMGEWKSDTLKYNSISGNISSGLP